MSDDNVLCASWAYGFLCALQKGKSLALIAQA